MSIEVTNVEGLVMIVKNEPKLRVIFEDLTREQVAYLLKLTKDLGHERTVDRARSQNVHT